MTVAIQIRDVPEDVRDMLAEMARMRGQSLQAYLLQVIKAEARKSRNATLLARFEGRDDGYAASPGEAAAEVSEGRAAREARLADDA
jgi:antitoxin FitA